MSEKRNKSRRTTPIIISIVAGALSTPVAYFTALAIERGPEAAYSIWLWGMYPTLLMLAVFLGYRWPYRPWHYGVLAVTSSYVGALVVIPGVGNLLPLEIIVELLISIPAGFAGWLGAWAYRSRSRSKSSPDQ